MKNKISIATNVFRLKTARFARTHQQHAGSVSSQSSAVIPCWLGNRSRNHSGILSHAACHENYVPLSEKAVPRCQRARIVSAGRRGRSSSFAGEQKTAIINFPPRSDIRKPRNSVRQTARIKIVDILDLPGGEFVAGFAAVRWKERAPPRRAGAINFFVPRNSWKCPEFHAAPNPSQH